MDIDVDPAAGDGATPDPPGLVAEPPAAPQAHLLRRATVPGATDDEAFFLSILSPVHLPQPVPGAEAAAPPPPPPLARRPSLRLPSAAAELMRGTSDDLFLSGLLQLDSSGAELASSALHQFMAGSEGNELLAAEFAALISPATGDAPSPAPGTAGTTGAQQATAAQHNLGAPDQAGASQAELQAEAAAARNLLASLDVSPSQPSPGMATAGPRGSTARAEASAAVAGAAAEAYAGPQLDVHTVQQQLLQLQYQQAQYMQAAGLAQLQGAPLVQVVQTPVYVDAATGQILHMGHPLPLLPSQALVLHAGTAGPAGSNPLSSPPSVGVAASAGSPHKQAKRRRSAREAPLVEGRASSSGTSALGRHTQLAQGYTHDPATGRYLRHGPSLMAAVQNDRELPVVTSLFEAHAAHPFSPTEPAASPHLQQQLVPVLQPGMRVSHSVPMLGAQPSLLHPADAPVGALTGMPHGPVISESTSHSPGPHAAKQAATDEQQATAGAQPAMPPKGFSGAVLRGVARELQGVASAPALATTVGEGPSKDAPLRGVKRDAWSLTWDAYLEPPGQGSGGKTSILQGFKQEAIHLGKWATKEQAGRAVDIASLKLLGEGAQTNFPAQTYSKALPALAAHSGEQVVAALKKDSALSLTRTSKFRGTRRIGPGQYEARLPPKPVPPPNAAAAGASGSGAVGRVAVAAAPGAAVPGGMVPVAAGAAPGPAFALQAQQAQMQQLLLQQQYVAAQLAQLDPQQYAAVLPIVAGDAGLPIPGDDLLGFDGLSPAADEEVQGAEASWDFGSAG